MIEILIDNELNDFSVPDNTQYQACFYPGSIPQNRAPRGRTLGSKCADKLQRTRTRPHRVDSDLEPSCTGDPPPLVDTHPVDVGHQRISSLSIGTEDCFCFSIRHYGACSKNPRVSRHDEHSSLYPPFIGNMRSSNGERNNKNVGDVSQISLDGEKESIFYLQYE